MRRQLLTNVRHAIPISFVFCLITVCEAHGQGLPMDPLPPIAPTEFSQCTALSSQWDRLASELDRLHENCLDAHKKSGDKRNPESGYGPGSTCTYSSCQDLHDRKYEVNTRKGPAVSDCRAQVEKFKEEERRAREAEEERQRAAEKAKRADAEKERADKSRKERDDDASPERKRADTEAKLIQMAAEQKRREQEALAQRTEARKQEMAALKNREADVTERMDRRIGDQTRASQDALKNAIPDGARENTIFPAPNAVKGDEYDLGALSRNNDGDRARDPAPMPDLGGEEALAEPNSALAGLISKVRDYVSPYVDRGKELFKEQLTEQLTAQGAEIRDTMIEGALGDVDSRTAVDMAKKFFDTSYKDPLHDMVGSAFGKTADPLLKEAGDDISKTISDYLRTGYGPLRGDGIVGSMRDVAIKFGVEKLTDYSRDVFVDKMTTKVTEVYRGISDRLLGPTDPIARPVQDTALLRLPGLITKIGSPAAAAKAIYNYGTDMVNSMGQMFENLMKSDLFGTAPPDPDNK